MEEKLNLDEFSKEIANQLRNGKKSNKVKRCFYIRNGSFEISIFGNNEFSKEMAE